MAKVSDIGGKRLISLAPDAWVKWVTDCPEAVAIDIIGSDFQWVNRENDVLIKAYSPEVGEFLIANELQLRYNDKMPVRMRAYAALAEEKYGLPVFPVLVNILQPSSTINVQGAFVGEVMGLQVRQDYCVLNLWEVEAELVFEQSLSPLLPFVPILKGGGEPQVVQRALVQLQRDESLVELESLLGFFASFVLETDVVQQIMRWDMTVLRESPWYQEILQEGENRGLERGIEQGLERGIEQGLERGIEHERALLVRLLTRKLGELSEEMIQSIQALSLEQLEALGDAVLDFQTVSDFESWLEQQAGQ